MKQKDWGNMLTYGMAVFAFLLVVLGPLTPEPPEPRTNIDSVELIQTTSQEVFFGDETQKIVVVSGNTSLPYSDSELVVGSTNYSFEEKRLKISLESVGGNFSKPVDPRPVNYTVKANFTEQVPELVLVHGAFERTTKFQGPRLTR